MRIYRTAAGTRRTKSLKLARERENQDCPWVAVIAPHSALRWSLARSGLLLKYAGLKNDLHGRPLCAFSMRFIALLPALFCVASCSKPTNTASPHLGNVITKIEVSPLNMTSSPHWTEIIIEQTIDPIRPLFITGLKDSQRLTNRLRWSVKKVSVQTDDQGRPIHQTLMLLATPIADASITLRKEDFTLSSEIQGFEDVVIKNAVEPRPTVAP
jgi:hypothetical protein